LLKNFKTKFKNKTLKIGDLKDCGFLIKPRYYFYGWSNLKKVSISSISRTYFYPLLTRRLPGIEPVQGYTKRNGTRQDELKVV